MRGALLLPPGRDLLLYPPGAQAQVRYRSTRRRHPLLSDGCGLEEAVLERLLEKIAAEQNIPMERSTPGVEVAYWGGPEGGIRMVINHNARQVVHDGETLEPFGCRITPWHKQG